MTKNDLLLIITATIVGKDFKFLLPTADFDTAAKDDAALTKIVGGLSDPKFDDARLSLMSDPATLPDDESFKAELLGFTARAMSSGKAIGLVTPKKGDENWNANVEAFALALTPEEATAEEETEQVAPDLTAEETTQVVEAAIGDENTVEAARELVEETLGVVVASAMSDDAIVKTALGLGLHKAQSTAVELTDAGINDIKTAAFSFVEAITGALNKLGASAEIQRSVISSIQSALPEQVTEQIVEEEVPVA